MARMDFPNSPTDGQTFTSENVTYTYIASKGYWDSVSTLSGIQWYKEKGLTPLF